jgi:hypothetical protein
MYAAAARRLPQASNDLFISAEVERFGTGYWARIPERVEVSDGVTLTRPGSDPRMPHDESARNRR